MLRRVIATRGIARACLSTAKEITAEDLKASALKVEKYKKFTQTSVQPKTFTDVMLPGTDPELPANLAELSVLNGMPAVVADRVVEIGPYPGKTLQSGDRFANIWQIKWQREEERWSNPLMGWTSTADPMSNLILDFDSREDAIAFAEKNGWKYEVKAEVGRDLVEPGETQYAHNFLSKRTLDVLKQEGGVKSKEFNNPKYGNSNWFMPLTFDGKAEVEQFGDRPAAAKTA